jgi:uncharacterized protein (TIGR02145 family)
MRILMRGKRVRGWGMVVSGGTLRLFRCGIDSITYAGVSYPTVLIGTQCWMAKNLNVGTRIIGTAEQANNSVIEKYCYDNVEANCTADGGLYQWNEAMQYVTTPGARGICPVGWHIPTDAEWHTLENYLATGTCNPSSQLCTWDCDPAGTALKSGGSSGFNAPLAGFRTTTGTFLYRSSGAYLWSSSESSTNAWGR